MILYDCVSLLPGRVSRLKYRDGEKSPVVSLRRQEFRVREAEMAKFAGQNTREGRTAQELEVLQGILAGLCPVTNACEEINQGLGKNRWRGEEQNYPWSSHRAGSNLCSHWPV